MAIVVESIGSSPGSTGNVVITKPTGTSVGDLLIACIALQDSGAFTPPAGWNLIRTTTLNSELRSYYKIATSTEVAASDFTFQALGAGTTLGVMLRLSGAGEITYDKEASTTNASVSFTPGSMGTHALYVLACASGHFGTWTEPSGMVERFDGGYASSGGEVSLSIHTGTNPSFSTVQRSSSANWMTIHGFFIDETPASAKHLTLLGIG